MSLMLAAFAAELKAQLSSECSEEILSKVFQDTKKQVFSFPTTPRSAVEGRCVEIDDHATALYNLCTRLKRNQKTNDETGSFRCAILFAKVFSFFMLDCTRYGGQSTTSNLVRLMKVCLKTAKGCIGELPVLMVQAFFLDKAKTLGITVLRPKLWKRLPNTRMPSRSPIATWL
jgi:hypothetical protein